jgi:hypothetical protein
VAPRNPKQLIVEGPDDLFSVVGLMRAHVNWPDGKENAPVLIEQGGGIDKILERDYLPVVLKTHGLRTLGVVLDADTNPQGRYASFRNLCSGLFPELPKEMPKEGLTAENPDHQRLGLWIMPDNTSEGALEIFLRFLVPENSAALWKHAAQSVTTARTLGANCREHHIGRANLYTWLAWQDPPGQSGGRALTQNILDPHSQNSAAFVKWFRDLYQL